MLQPPRDGGYRKRSENEPSGPLRSSFGAHRFESTARLEDERDRAPSARQVA
jgi:hypothetical protein